MLEQAENEKILEISIRTLFFNNINKNVKNT